MKKSLFLAIAAILLFGITKKFTGQEIIPGKRKLLPSSNPVIEQQSKMTKAPFFSGQELHRWMKDRMLPDRHRMTMPIGRGDYRGCTRITGETIGQHELSAGVDTAWVRHYASGHLSSDAATAIAIDGSGNIYVTGSGRSFPTGDDYLTVKYDPSGVQIWAARYNGPGNSKDDARALVVDISCNVYVTGTSVGSNTGPDFATIKYNSAGVQQWVVRYSWPRNDWDEANALAVDSSGNVYVTGTSVGSGTGRDFATIKYNSAGVLQWVARYNGPGNADDGAIALKLDASGNVYVTGRSEGLGTRSDFATIKYNSAGVQQWVVRYYNAPGNDWNAANALAVDASGNVYVTGSSHGSSTGIDYATVKYNSAGAEQWVARYNGPGNYTDMAVALAADASGNVYVTGSSLGSDGSYDYATVKYNYDGVEQWVARYNGPGNYTDTAVALAVDAFGNVYVTGTSEGDFTTVNYNSAGVEQWVARYNGLGNTGEGATSLAVDTAGNVYVTGTSEGNFTTVKYNSAGVEQWVARYNGPTNSYDNAFALAVDSSDNVYVTGSSGGDFATVKYNSAGAEQWVARYNESGNDYDAAVALAVDASGDVYVTGRSGVFDNEEDYATVKYNSAGVQLWAVRYSGQGYSYDDATALAVDASGNVYVTGWSGYFRAFDYATIKYNSAGVEQWVARYNGLENGDDRAYALAVDASGNVYVTGSGGMSTNWDYATVKYNSAGTEQWVARYNGPGNDDDRAYALAVDASGNVYVTGTSGGSGTGRDFATIKYNSDGIEQWVARYNGPENELDEANALAVDSYGCVYVTGRSEGYRAGPDFATIKYNSAGVLQWVARYNGPGNSDDGAIALKLDASGNVYVTGTSDGSEWRVYTTIKYVQTQVSVKKEWPDKPSRYWLSQNYPNPFNPSTTIEFALPKSAFVTLKVYNLLGEEVATLIAEQREAGVHKLNWDARGLATGVYLYRLEVGDPSTSSPNKSGQARQDFVQTRKLILLR